MRRIAASLLSFGCLFWLPVAAAGEDVAGARDHPLLTRYPGSFITEYSKNYNATAYQVGVRGAAAKSETVEGDTTALMYFHDSAELQPSALQVLRNYQNAIKSIGGRVLYERLPLDGDAGESTLQVTTGGKEVWIRVEPGYGAPTHYYKLIITEVAAMTQVVSANQLLDELNQHGFIALYINFDTGKAELKQDGLATVKEIVSLMKAQPALRLGVEGHTDNVGDAAANKKLSEARARSVMRAIVAAGIDAARLSAAGYGPERPVADHRSEDGRRKNRRVELVKRQ